MAAPVRVDARALRRGARRTGVLGALTALLSVALFVCTGMIYASLRLLPEWATPLTPINYLLLGAASGTVLAAAYARRGRAFARAADRGPRPSCSPLSAAAMRCASLLRNRALRPKTTLQTAIGVPHPQIAQRAQGFMGGSFNTREFFHGATPRRMRAMKWGFLLLAFAVPIVLLGAGSASAPLLAAAFVLQYLGLLAERWYFFADARHPQNLYYQSIS